MLPTLSGRIQTRIFVLLIIGGLWTLIITPVLPISGSLSDAYGVTFRILIAVTVLGIGWELIYHFLQQFRWEKDWPTFFGLITAVNEGALVWILISAGAIPGVDSVPGNAFLIDFATVWLVTWLWVNGPMRVPLIRWRFRGGSVIGGTRRWAGGRKGQPPRGGPGGGFRPCPAAGPPHPQAGVSVSTPPATRHPRAAPPSPP